MSDLNKLLDKAHMVNIDFAFIIRGICSRKNIPVDQFLKGMDQPFEIARKMFYGEHPWMGYTTFRELERLTKTSPGYIEQVYRNIHRDSHRGLYELVKVHYIQTNS